MDFRAALLDQTRDFGELIRGADPSTPVPTCPDWTLKQLFRHVGRGNRWAAQIIADRTDRAAGPARCPRRQAAGRPRRRDRLVERGRAADHRRRRPRRLRHAGVDVHRAARPCGWWIRRRLHEATVHRADAALALGRDFELAPELAADGISEWIELMTDQADSAAAAVGTWADAAPARHRRRAGPDR